MQCLTPEQWAAASCYWLVWIKRFLFGLRARTPLLSSICSPLEMRNAPGKTANNSRSTGSSLVLGLIKITAHESDSWVLRLCLDECVLPLRNILGVFLECSVSLYNSQRAVEKGIIMVINTLVTSLPSLVI